MKIIAISILSFLVMNTMANEGGGTRGGPAPNGGDFRLQDDSSFGERSERSFGDVFEGRNEDDEGRGPRSPDGPRSDRGEDRDRFFKLVGLGFHAKNRDGFTFDDFVQNITCPEVEDEPLCPLHPTKDGQERNGTWVCRSVHHPITGVLRNSSACIDPDYALETDECGCCEDDCPQVCECGCNGEEGEEGVFVQGPSIASPGEMVELCMPPGAAVSLVDAVEVVECVTSCSE